MANTRSAKKRVTQNEKRRKHNATLKSTYRTYVKKVETAIAGGTKETANKVLHESVRVLDSNVSKGILHKNKAAHLKSRLNAQIKKMK